MVPQLLRFGKGEHRVVQLDGLDIDPAGVVDLAAALAPFPRGPNPNYPGVRRVLYEADGGAFAYACSLLEACAPYIGGAFDMDGFDLIEASFSIVTTPPGRLAPAQRAPHVDSTDPRYLAVMHFLGGVAGSGTAFYRQRSTGIEAVTPATLATFVAAARRESATLDGYIHGSNAAFEEIGRVAAVPGRVLIYQGALLHSGIIPPDLPLDADPRRGRLTANLFVKGQ